MVARALPAFRSAFLLIACGAAACGAAETRSRVPPTEATVELDSLRPGVWIHTSYYTYPNGSRFSSNGLVVRDDGALTLIDTAWGERLTVSLLDRIQSGIGLPVERAVVTHAHGDRTAGADVLRDRGISVHAHPETIHRALGMGLAPPSDSLSGLHEHGGVARLGSLEIYYPGPGHSPENLMVWIPSARVLFGGCAVRPADATTLGNTAHADRNAWPGAIQRALERYGNAEVVVPGHGAKGGPELLRHTLSLLRR
jgi:glyoxylase-like metal-dependent hydrolase (beta-lactamase superfamily II)